MCFFESGLGVFLLQIQVFTLTQDDLVSGIHVFVINII